MKVDFLITVFCRNLEKVKITFCKIIRIFKRMVYVSKSMQQNILNLKYR